MRYSVSVLGQKMSLGLGLGCTKPPWQRGRRPRWCSHPTFGSSSSATAPGRWDSWQRSRRSTEIKVTSCFPMAALGHSVVLYNYVLGASALLPWFPINSCTLPDRDCKHPANGGRGEARKDHSAWVSRRRPSGETTLCHHQQLLSLVA